MDGKSGDGFKKKKPWKWLDQLSFLAPLHGVSDHHSNVESFENDIISLGTESPERRFDVIYPGEDVGGISSVVEDTVEIRLA